MNWCAGSVARWGSDYGESARTVARDRNWCNVGGFGHSHGGTGTYGAVHRFRMHGRTRDHRVGPVARGVDTCRVPFSPGASIRPSTTRVNQTQIGELSCGRGDPQRCDDDAADRRDLQHARIGEPRVSNRDPFNLDSIHDWKIRSTQKESCPRPRHPAEDVRLAYDARKVAESVAQAPGKVEKFSNLDSRCGSPTENPG